MTPGPHNLITDVAGLSVGHADDGRLGSGVTVVIFDEPAVASVDVRGGAPGTRETDLLAPEKTVGGIDAVVLSGGSAFGLDAAGGVQDVLAAMGRGFPVGPVRVPIVPAAILFDLLNGGNKDWGESAPYRALGASAARQASRDPFPLGTVGAGFGATTADLKGGLGSASAVLPSGHTVGALVAVNAVGSLTVGDGPHFRAAPYEIDGEFGGVGVPQNWNPAMDLPRMKGLVGGNTTIAVVATDAVLTKAEARHVATMAQDGLALAIRPVHTPLDGDTVFVAATGRRPLSSPLYDVAMIGTVGASVLARACARAVHAATALPFPGAQPSWSDRFAQKR